MLFEMSLLLGEGSTRREVMGGQFLFGVRCLGTNYCRHSARE